MFYIKKFRYFAIIPSYNPVLQSPIPSYYPVAEIEIFFLLSGVNEGGWRGVRILLILHLFSQQEIKIKNVIHKYQSLQFW